MPTDRMQTMRRKWNAQQTQLRRFLTRERNYRKAAATFLDQHAMVHAAKISPGSRWSFEDEILRDATDAQLRIIPAGREHSIVWMIWHIARIEDVTMNLLVAGRPQLLHSGNWLGKLGIPYRDVGNGMPAEEISRLSGKIDLDALFAYRLAVGRRTREIVRRMGAEAFWEPIEPAGRKRVLEEKAVRKEATGLIDFWYGHTKATLLLMPPTRHCFVHLNEARLLLPKLRRLAAA